LSAVISPELIEPVLARSFTEQELDRAMPDAIDRAIKRLPLLAMDLKVSPSNPTRIV
jgi:hypothetical protein